jgi:hypothetical protein
MKISEGGTLAAIVKEGDYVVFKADRNGISVEYAPGGPAGAAVVGAFAARRGKIRHWNAPEASAFLQNYSLSAEDHLIAAIEVGGTKKEKTLADQLIEALQVYSDSGYEETNILTWSGKLEDFHRTVLYPMTGVPFSSQITRAMKAVAKRLPGVEVFKPGRELFVKVRWDQVTP